MWKWIAALSFALAIQPATAQSLKDGMYILSGKQVNRNTKSFGQAWIEGGPPFSSRSSDRYKEDFYWFPWEWDPCLIELNKEMPPLCRRNGRFIPFHISRTDSGRNFSHSCSITFNGSSVSINSSERKKTVTRQQGCTFTANLTDKWSEDYNINGTSSGSRYERSIVNGCVASYSQQFFDWTAEFKKPISYIGPVVHKECPPNNIASVLLNPHYLYPDGDFYGKEKDKVFNEIALPGSIDVDEPSGPPTVHGVALDGNARVIVGFSTADDGPVTFTIRKNALGGLTKLDNLFEKVPDKLLATISVDPSPVPGHKGLYAAGTVFIAPELPDNLSELPIVEIQIDQGRHRELQLIHLAKPPLLLVHGIWADPTSWDPWRVKLNAAGLPAYLAARYLSFADFLGFAVQGSLNNHVQTLLELTRQRGIASAQVDVVAHSMGGLAARAYAGKKARAGSYYAGNINRIITINTPHEGTLVADFVEKYKDRRLSIVPPPKKFNNPKLVLLQIAGMYALNQPLSFYIGKVLGPVSTGVSSLRVKSSQILALPDRNRVPFETIATSRENSAVEIALNLLVGRLKLPGDPTVDSIIQSNDNDTLVSFASQIGQDGSNHVFFNNLIHTDPLTFRNVYGFKQSYGVLESDAVISTTICMLRRGKMCYKPAPASTPSDDNDEFILEEYSEESEKHVDISQLPRRMTIGDEAWVYASSSTKSIIHNSYMIEQNGKLTFYDVEPRGGFLLAPKVGGDVKLSIVAAFEDMTFSKRTWTIPVGIDVKLNGIIVDEPVVRMHGKGSSYGLYPYGITGDGRQIDLAAVASYDVLEGEDTVVRVLPGGILEAVGPGNALVRVSHSGHSVDVRVSVQR